MKISYMDKIEHTIIFNDEITHKKIQTLIEYINAYEFVNLYFATNGGRLDIMSILVDFLNYRNKLNSIRVILFDYIGSAGTLILTKYKGTVYTSGLRAIMLHAPDISANIIRKDDFQKGMEQLLEDTNNLYFKDLLKIGITNDEIAKIKKGDDVYLFKKDITKLKRKLVEFKP
mgnify:CR=1 FL=1